jgi:hypothetical protein
VKIDSVVPLMAVFTGATQGVIKTFETIIGGASMLVDGFALVGNAVGAAAGALATGEDVIAAVGAEAETTGASLEKTALHLIGLKTASEEAAIRQEQMKKELQALREETDPYGAALEALKKKLEDAAKEFEKTGDAVKLTQTALQDFFAAPAQNLNVDGVLKLAAALKAVGTQAEDSGQRISNTLGEELAKLSSEQLAELERQARSAMVAASDGSETSRAAFAELGQVVEGVVLARLQRLGVDGPEALRGVSTAATDAISDFQALAESGVLSADGIQAAFSGALQQLDNPKELDAFKVNIEELGEAGVLTGEQVGLALLQIRQRMQEVASDPAFAALNTELANIRAETERGIETGQREREALQGRIQSAIELAKAKGDEAEAARLSALATKEEVDQAELRIQQLQRQQTEIDAHIQRQYAAANADGVYATEERKVIEALKDKSVAIGDEIQKIEAKLPLQQREADEAARAAGPIGQLIRLYKEQADEHQRAAQVANAYTDVRLKEIEGSIRVAKAKGDEEAATRALNEATQLTIEKAEAASSAKQKEAEAYKELIDATRLKLAADGEITEAEKAQLAAMDDKLIALKQEGAELQQNAEHTRAMAQANKGAAQAAKEAADEIKRAAEREKEAAEQRKAAAAFIDQTWEKARQILQKTGGDVEKLNAAFIKLQNEMVTGTIVTSFAQWAAITVNAAKEVANQYESQKERVNEAAAALNEWAETGSGVYNVSVAMSEAARYVNGGMSLLGDQELAGLRSALDAANARLERMKDLTTSAKEKLIEMEADVLEAQGKSEAAAQLRESARHERALNEIEGLRAAAEGNTALISLYDKMAEKERELHGLKRENITSDDAKTSSLNNLSAAYVRVHSAALGVEETTKRIGGISLEGLHAQLDTATAKAIGLATVL